MVDDASKPALRFEWNVRRGRLEAEQLRLVLATCLSPDSNAIDIGAHNGRVIREILRLAPKGRHIAFEPLPNLAARLARLFPAIEIREEAVSDQNGQSTFMRVVDALPYSGLRKRKYPPHVKAENIEEIVVRTVRLDDVVPATYSPAFVKIDVEGAEELVLRGAVETLQRARPVIYFEHAIGGLAQYDLSPASLFEFLVDELHFRVFDLSGDGPYRFAEFEEGVMSHRWINFLARP